MEEQFQILNFYEFKDLGTVEHLRELKPIIVEALRNHKIYGTIIIAEEGYNASLSGYPTDVPAFVEFFEELFDTQITPKISFNSVTPFRKHEVKIKPEIVTLKKPVDLSRGEGSHIDPKEWNALISDPSVYLLDTRNDYEYKTGTFPGAVNPRTEKFSDLPEFVEKNLDPQKNKKIAMFCTGGIRCEKFAPYMKSLGFEEVYQLNGGILKYLEEVPNEEQLWDGECFVFDERISVNSTLDKGVVEDWSLRNKNKGKRSEAK